MCRNVSTLGQPLLDIPASMGRSISRSTLGILVINLAGQERGYQMGVVEAGSLPAPLARRRAIATRRPTLVLFDSIDDSQKAHSSRKSEGKRRCIRIDGICRIDIIPSSRSRVRWLAVLDSDHRYVELNVIRDPSIRAGRSDFF